MAYLLTIIRDDGAQADVDVDLEALDLDSPEGAAELVREVKAALTDLEAE